ncbi:hypothetical protein ACO2RV_15845 [Ancylobacter sp. VNQ12]|uniref:hypothetical protein n=1 Tax=Ancylobacter sp. VNQ12 TaxID=3400920 RepID=UPI003C04A6E1
MNNTIDSFGRLYVSLTEAKSLIDYGSRRFNPFGFSFDSRPDTLQEPNEQWEDDIKRQHYENREKYKLYLSNKYGNANLDVIINNVNDLGIKNFSLISYHNEFFQQCRDSFIIGAYYPALVSACALGERIINHLIVDLREFYSSSKFYQKVHSKSSFDNWIKSIEILNDWGVLINDVPELFQELSQIRHRSVHFNPSTYKSVRTDALTSLTLMNKITSKQFGVFGGQPWYIEGTSGAQFIKKEYEENPFVKTYILPISGFVGPEYGMNYDSDFGWQHLDYSRYYQSSLSDTEFARAYRERDPSKVVSIEMIQKKNNR